MEISNPFDKKTMKLLRKKLEQILENLESEARQEINGMRKLKLMFPDPADRAGAETARNLNLRIRDRQRKLGQKVREAIQRMESDKFGFCEFCDEPIDRTRLLARPVTTMCISCKEQQEIEELKS